MEIKIFKDLKILQRTNLMPRCLDSLKPISMLCQLALTKILGMV